MQRIAEGQMADPGKPTSIAVYARDAVARALSYKPLIAALKAGFAQGATTMERSVHAMPGGNFLILMPVADAKSIAIKTVTVFPGNPAERAVPSVHALVLLLDAATGVPKAIVDGTEITLRRTGAASALAASYLARADARRLLMVGTGALAPHLIAAHAAVRPIEDVTIWGRTPAKADALAARLSSELHPLRVTASRDLASAAAAADIISCATNARLPLIEGRWLKPGTHVDLIGSFSPDARESDDDVVRNARIYVDTREGALHEAGDLLIPLNAGVISMDAILGDLSDLCRGTVQGRRNPLEVTVFKSVGAAIEDLIAAQMVLAHAQ